MRSRIALYGCIIGIFTVIILVSVSPLKSKSSPENREMTLVQRGEYLVTIGGCNDCHTPLMLTEDGVDFDMSRMLSGYPAELKLPEIPWSNISVDTWVATVNMGNAYAGLWGVSFPANLTPDKETGIGSWTEDIFKKAIRTGKHMGEGRDILPPMPWFNYRHLTDEDFSAVYAYLRTVKPIHNPVPEPLPPPGAE
jgi:hypothetical protein